MMLRGLGVIQTSPTDMCLDLSNYTQVPCSNPPDPGNLLCLNEANGQHDKCRNFPNGGATPVPIVTLQEALQMCAGKPQGSCQVTTAAPCDPVWIAAGFQSCSNQGPLSIYTYMLKDYSGANQYDAPVTAHTLALTPADVSYLVYNNLIQPPATSNSPIVPTLAPPSSGGVVQPPPNVYQWGSGIQAGQTTITQTPTTVPQAQGGGVLPGGSTPTGGTTGYQSTGGDVTAKAPTSDLISGVPNNMLYVAVAALFLLVAMK